jgi:N utilization substance protein A
MQLQDIKRIVEQVGKDKGIEPDVLIKTLEEALASAARKKLGRNADIEVQYNAEAGEIEVFQFMEVVENVEEPETQITLEEGRKLDSECEIGDSLGSKIDTASFGRIAAQSAKQVIIQKMKDAEKNAVYNGFITRKGEIINGIVQRIDRGDIIVNLGHTEAILPSREQISREVFRRGDRIRALIKDVLLESRGPQIILTRASVDFLIALFKTEVPEIADSIVAIEGTAREAGGRSKIAVSSTDADIDPVGACVGMKGCRVQNVVQELKGEKIDIVTWHPDVAKYVCNALAPAEVSKVIIDNDNKSMEVIVPADYLSVAIGKKGQNVRLASQLTKWQIDVVSEDDHSSALKKEFDSLLSLDGMSMVAADTLHTNGFCTLDDIAGSSVEELVQLLNLNEELVKSWIDEAKKPNRPKKAGAAARHESKDGEKTENADAQDAELKKENTDAAETVDDDSSEKGE